MTEWTQELSDDEKIELAEQSLQPVMQPRVNDNDDGEIIVSLRDKEIRCWSYASDDERRKKMLLAREYVEGWCDAAAHTSALGTGK